jgi:hypothetical protein
MISLLITPCSLLILSFLIKDKDIVLVSRLLFLALVANVLINPYVPQEYFYIKEALFDTIQYSFVFLLKDRLRYFLLGIPCVVSFLLNIYEAFSYYQTVFYPFREGIQFLLLQLIVVGLCLDAEWKIRRDICKKTNTQR